MRGFECECEERVFSQVVYSYFIWNPFNTLRKECHPCCDSPEGTWMNDRRPVAGQTTSLNTQPEPALNFESLVPPCPSLLFLRKNRSSNSCNKSNMAPENNFKIFWVPHLQFERCYSRTRCNRKSSKLCNFPLPLEPQLELEVIGRVTRVVKTTYWNSEARNAGKGRGWEERGERREEDLP